MRIREFSGTKIIRRYFPNLKIFSTEFSEISDSMKELRFFSPPFFSVFFLISIFYFIFYVSIFFFFGCSLLLWSVQDLPTLSTTVRALFDMLHHKKKNEIKYLYWGYSYNSLSSVIKKWIYLFLWAAWQKTGFNCFYE